MSNYNDINMLILFYYFIVTDAKYFKASDKSIALLEKLLNSTY